MKKERMVTRTVCLRTVTAEVGIQFADGNLGIKKYAVELPAGLPDYMSPVTAAVMSKEKTARRVMVLSIYEGDAYQVKVGVPESIFLDAAADMQKHGRIHEITGEVNSDGE